MLRLLMENTFSLGLSNSGQTSCDFAAKNCDALLQYGVYYKESTCVTDAANAGDFLATDLMVVLA